MDVRQKLKLIERIQKHPSIYDPSDNDYRNKTVNDKLWFEIAFALSEDVEDCRRIWKNLRDSFQRIDKRIENEEMNLTGEKRKSVSWRYYDKMTFLKPWRLYNVEHSDCEENGKEHQRKKRSAEHSKCEENGKEHQRKKKSVEHSKCEENGKEHKRKKRSAEHSKCEENGKELQRKKRSVEHSKCEENGKELQRKKRSAEHSDCEENGKEHQRKTRSFEHSNCEENGTEHQRKSSRLSEDNAELMIDSDASSVSAIEDSFDLFMPCPYCRTSQLNLEQHLQTKCLKSCKPDERRKKYQEIKEQVRTASEFFLVKESTLIAKAGGQSTIKISSLLDFLEENGFFVVRDSLSVEKQEPVDEMDCALDKEAPCKTCPCCIWYQNKKVPDRNQSIESTLLSTSVKLSADTLNHVGTLADKMESVQSLLKQIVARMSSSDQKLDNINMQLGSLHD